MVSNFPIMRNQVNLLVYRPDRPYFKQKQKNNITKFWATGFFLIYYFLLFEFSEPEKDIHLAKKQNNKDRRKLKRNCETLS